VRRIRLHPRLVLYVSRLHENETTRLLDELDARVSFAGPVWRPSAVTSAAAIVMSAAAEKAAAVLKQLAE